MRLLPSQITSVSGWGSTNTSFISAILAVLSKKAIFILWYLNISQSFEYDFCLMINFAWEEWSSCFQMGSRTLREGVYSHIVTHFSRENDLSGRQAEISLKKSSIVAFFHSYLWKQVDTALEKCQSPIRLISCFMADAPFVQVIPSKLAKATPVLSTGPRMG